MMYLFKGGRITLVKSTLSNLPMYFMSLYSLLVGVANCVEKLQCDFLWGELGEEFKYYLVSWSNVYSPISEGGLGGSETCYCLLLLLWEMAWVLCA